MQTVWVVCHIDDVKGLCVAGVFATRDEAMAIVMATPKSGAVEFELGRDYRAVERFEICTAAHWDGILA